MRYVLYNILLLMLAPMGACYLVCSRRYRVLLRRFAPKIPSVPRGTILWVHGCSVGEVFVASVLVRALREHYPEATILLTVNTVSGYQLAKETLSDISVTFAPFDLAFCVRQFIKRVRPAMLVLLETELWPGLVRESRRQNIPVVVVNGRISPRKFPNYKKYACILPPVFTWLSHVAAQEAVYRDRFVALGVSPDNITLTGNIKYDGVRTEVSECLKRSMREENGFDEGHDILVFGSTRPGDEVLAAECWQCLKDAYPNLCFIIAPRHLNRLKEGVAAFKGEQVTLRSEIKAGKNPAKTRVLFLDSLGELGSVYAISRVAVIGGSFFAGVEGHNPLEPAALGIPTVFGPYMGNFPDAAEMLLGADGAIQVTAPGGLVPVLKRLLDDPEFGRTVGEAGRSVILNNQGAVARTVDQIATFIA